MMGIVELWLLFVAYSFFGWLFETVYCSLSERRVVYLGYLNGPWCPIYGAGSVLVTLVSSASARIPDGVSAAALSIADMAMAVVGTSMPLPLAASLTAKALVVRQALVGSPIAIGLASMVGCGILEYVTSWAMERAYHMRWWDYTGRIGSINGRVCLASLLLFFWGSIGIAFVFNPPLSGAISSVMPEARLAAAGATVALFLADVAVTRLGLCRFRNKVDDVCAQMTELMRDAAAGSERLARLEGLRASFVRTLNAQERRIVVSFPSLRAMPARLVRRVRSLVSTEQDPRA